MFQHYSEYMFSGNSVMATDTLEVPDYLEKQKQGKWIQETRPTIDAVKQRV